MAKRIDDQWAALTRDLSARVAKYAPEWTEPSAGDPGVTLAELIGFLAESMLTPSNLTAADRARLLEVIARLDRVIAAPCDDATLTRPNYFAGKVLTAEDLRQEQDYHRSHRRRHNRLLHRIGIVRGLEVSLQPGQKGEDTTIEVSPGVAVSPEGDELLVCEPVTLDPCSGTSPCWVTVAILERPVGPTVDGDHERIDEAAAVTVTEAIGPHDLAIARLVRDPAGGWQVDPGWRPPRAG